MKYLWSSVAVAALLAACGDEPTNNVSNAEDVESSSSISKVDSVESSSSVSKADSAGSSSSISKVDSTAKSSSSKGTKYETVVSYGEMTDPRDSKTYKTITLKYFDGEDSITSDTWMVEDLAYDAEYADQVIVENGVHLYAMPAAMDSLKSGCGYLDLADIWYCILPKNFQGICPDGWRMPSSKEASHFASILKGNSDAEAAFYHSSSASECEDSDYFWTSTELGFGLFSGSGVRKECVNSFDYTIESFAPVRCLKGDGVHVEPVIPTPEKYKGNFGTLTDSRDDKTYKTVKIGEQTWMAENLNYFMSDSTSICNDMDEDCSRYHRFYTWEAAKEACPTGWHLPTEAEFTTLKNFVLKDWPDYSVLSLLGEQYGWETVTYDAYGFNAKYDYSPFDNPRGEFTYKGSSAYWSSTEGSDGSSVKALWLQLDSGSEIESIDKNYYAGVRCLKD